MAVMSTLMTSWSMTLSADSGSWWPGCSRPGATTLSLSSTTWILCVEINSVDREIIDYRFLRKPSSLFYVRAPDLRAREPN